MRNVFLLLLTTFNASACAYHGVTPFPSIRSKRYSRLAASSGDESASEIQISVETDAEDVANSTPPVSSSELETSTDFDWASVAKDNNYIWYLNLKARRSGKSADTSNNSVEEEVVTDLKSPITILAILFFVPIFTSEFFFSVSRPFICASQWAAELCAPAIS
jgi:hypothetical protein